LTKFVTFIEHQKDAEKTENFQKINTPKENTAEFEAINKIVYKQKIRRKLI
jgi:hypothetical protein